MTLELEINIEEIVKIIKKPILEELKCVSGESSINPSAMDFIKTTYPGGWKKTIDVQGLGNTTVGYNDITKSIYFINNEHISFATLFGTMIKINSNSTIEVSCFPDSFQSEINVLIDGIKYSNNMSNVLENDTNESILYRYRTQMSSNLYPITLERYREYNSINIGFDKIFKKLGMCKTRRDRLGNIINGPGPRTLEELKSVIDNAKIDYEKIDYELNLSNTLDLIKTFIKSKFV